MSSKYSKQVIETTCKALDWTEGLTTTDALVLVVFDSLERAPWWEEVGSDYGVDFGEPFREECAGRAWERTNKDPYRPIGSSPHQGSSFRYFRDTRWTPPAKPPKVGDVIENAEYVKHLPDGSVFLDCDGHAWQVDDGIAYAAGGGRWFVDGDFDYLPLTVVYVPKAGGDDD